MITRNQQIFWLKTERKYRKFQQKLHESSDQHLMRKLTYKLDILRRRLLNLNRKWKLGIATSVLMAWMGATPVQAQFTSPLELSSLNGNNGFTINGIDPYDQSGRQVSSAGDINGDGLADIIIGASNADPNGNNSGETYVIFGDANGFGAVLELSSLNGSNGFTLSGIDAGDSSGSRVATAGDVNGDGIDDVIIGTPGGDPNGNSAAGESYVVFGRSTAFTSTIELSSLDGIIGFIINGADNYDSSGISVNSAGDVNGDGLADLIIGAAQAYAGGSTPAGESYVVFGSSSGFTSEFDLSSLDGNNGFAIFGAADSDRSGRAVGSAGDVNGDGIDDIIIGAYSADPNGTSSGESYVIFGKSSAFSAVVQLSSLNGTNGFVLNGKDVDNRSGRAVGSAGDLNGDGLDDILIGAQYASPNGSTSGEGYVVFGTSSGFGPELELSALDGSNGFAIPGIDAGDQLGRAIKTAGDVNKDGLADIIVGAERADPNGSDSGESYVIFGRRTAFDPVLQLSLLDISEGLTLNGVTAGSLSGYSVSSAGDVNGDGTDDLLISAIFANAGARAYAGQTHVVFGQDEFSPVVESFSPQDGMSTVLVDANLVIDFDEDVTKGTGNITIKKSSDDSDVEVIDVTSGQVTISNDMVTINPTADLPRLTDLYVLIDDGTIEDLAGNTFAGITDPTIWNFRTESDCDIPTNLSASMIDNTSATIGWEDVNPGSTYEVQYKLAVPGSPWNSVDMISGNSTTLFEVLSPGTTYRYKVRSTCTINEEDITTAWSTSETFTTALNGCDTPTGLMATPGPDDEDATISWNKVNDGATNENYVLEYKPVEPTPIDWISVNVPGAASTFLDDVLTPGTTYKYRVYGECDLEGGTTVQTAPSTAFFTTNSSTCAVPGGLFANGVDNTSATLNWTDVSGDDYLVEYKVAGVSGPWDQVSATGSNTILNMVLMPGTLYKYRVSRQCDFSGTIVTTAPSTPAFFTTTLDGCQVPNTLDAPVIGDNTATVTWNAINTGATNEMYILEYRAPDVGTPWQQVTVSAGTADLDMLLEGTRYKYRVYGQCELEMGTTVTTAASASSFFTTTVTKTVGEESSLIETLTTGTEEDKLKLLTYPNPSQGMVTIDFDPQVKGEGRLTIYSLNGSKVIDQPFKDRLSELIDLSQQGRGMYLARVVFGGKVYEGRILIR